MHTTTPDCKHVAASMGLFRLLSYLIVSGYSSSHIVKRTLNNRYRHKLNDEFCCKAFFLIINCTLKVMYSLPMINRGSIHALCQRCFDDNINITLR